MHVGSLSPIFVGRIGLLVGCASVWEALSRSQVVNPDLLPPFTQVVATLVDILSERTVHAHIAVTALEVGIAFVISIPLGVLIGVLVAESKYWGDVFKPLLFFPLSIPKSVFLPLFILALGITLSQKVAFGVFSTLFIVMLSTTTAVESVSADHVMVARSYGATPMQIVLKVYLPSMLPILLEGIRLAMIFNFTGIIVAEMYASRSGLGYLVTAWGDSFAMRHLLAGILLISAMAIVFNETIRSWEKRFSHWRND